MAFFGITALGSQSCFAAEYKHRYNVSIFDDDGTATRGSVAFPLCSVLGARVCMVATPLHARARAYVWARLCRCAGCVSGECA
ncbi:hypothetical protein EON67_08895 [archaeon]|nr:MAG: hypothetical protein EON67_08895 [archaeon]